LKRAGDLHGQDGGKIEEDQRQHGRRLPEASDDIVEALCQLAFKPGAGYHAGIVEDAGHGDDGQDALFRLQVGKNAIRMCDLFDLLCAHALGFSSAALFLGLRPFVGRFLR
jgi:hypothetical protein